jgi:hypothetical protein
LGGGRRHRTASRARPQGGKAGDRANGEDCAGNRRRTAQETSEHPPQGGGGAREQGLLQRACRDGLGQACGHGVDPRHRGQGDFQGRDGRDYAPPRELRPDTFERAVHPHPHRVGAEAQSLAHFREGSTLEEMQENGLAVAPFQQVEHVVEDEEPGGPFYDEAYELAHLCLLERPERFRRAYLTLARAAMGGPINPAAVKAAFGEDAGALGEELWRDRAAARDDHVRFAALGITPPPALHFRRATPAEVDRLAAVWQHPGGFP